VLRLDLRRFGEPDERPFAKWSHHRAVIETLNGLGIDAVHAIGSSPGAGVAVSSPWPHPGSSCRCCSRVRAVPHRRPEARSPSVLRRRECGADGRRYRCRRASKRRHVRGPRTGCGCCSPCERTRACGRPARHARGPRHMTAPTTGTSHTHN